MTALEVVGIAAAGLTAGFVNTLAGGGSLITLPALMWAGLPADIANGTNRVGILLQSATAALTFDGASKLDRRALPWLLLPALVGSALGAGLATLLDAATLEPIILVCMVVFALLLAVRPAILAPPEGADPVDVRSRPAAFATVLAAGFYAGFLQAGVGFVLLAVLGGVLRYDLVRANAIKVVLVLALTVVALGIFIADDLVRWAPGLVLAVSGALGGFLAARFALTKGAKVLRWVVFAAVCVEVVVLVAR